jgi:hypothetical protein
MQRHHPDTRVAHLGPSKPAPGKESPDDRIELEHYRRFHERIRRDDDDQDENTTASS